MYFFEGFMYFCQGNMYLFRPSSGSLSSMKTGSQPDPQSDG